MEKDCFCAAAFCVIMSPERGRGKRCAKRAKSSYAGLDSARDGALQFRFRLYR
jgi:hypothetical protein